MKPCITLKSVKIHKTKIKNNFFSRNIEVILFQRGCRNYKIVQKLFGSKQLESVIGNVTLKVVIFYKHQMMFWRKLYIICLMST